GHDPVRVGQAGRGDRAHDLLTVVRGHLPDRDACPAVHAGQADPGRLLVDTAEDRDLAAVLAHVILMLGVAPAREPAADDDDHQHYEDGGHDGPGPLARPPAAADAAVGGAQILVARRAGGLVRPGEPAGAVGRGIRAGCRRAALVG